MPPYYNPLLLKPYTPVFRPMPVPGIETAIDDPVVCVKMSARLIPYLLGLLEIYRWPDALQGTTEEVKTALGVFQDLMVILSEADVCDPCCPETNQLLLQLLASNNASYALQLEQLDDGTPQSFAPDAPANWTGNSGQSNSEAGRREAALCRAIERLMSEAIRAVHETLVASGIVLGAIATGVGFISPIPGFGLALALFAAMGAAAFEAAMNDTNAQRRVRCCIFDNLKNAGAISFEAFKNAAATCDFDGFTNETFIAEQIMKSAMSTESNYRSFVKILGGHYNNTEAGDNGDDCVCCDETARIKLLTPWPVYTGGAPGQGDGATITKTGERSWQITSGVINRPGQIQDGWHAVYVQSEGKCNFCVKAFSITGMSGQQQFEVWNKTGPVFGGISVGSCIAGFNIVAAGGPFEIDIEICEGGCEGHADCVGCD